MKVKLVKDIYDGNGQIKTTVRPLRKVAIGWFQGSIIELSETSAQKFIERGDAEAFVESTNEEPQA